MHIFLCKNWPEFTTLESWNVNRSGNSQHLKVETLTDLEKPRLNIEPPCCESGYKLNCDDKKWSGKEYQNEHLCRWSPFCWPDWRAQNGFWATLEGRIMRFFSVSKKDSQNGWWQSRWNRLGTGRKDYEYVEPPNVWPGLSGHKVLKLSTTFNIPKPSVALDFKR